MRILIVDDEVRIRSSLKGLLEDDGHEAETCETGEEALARFPNEPYDLVFLDVMLPGMDGIRVMESLRKADPGVRVFMMSGKADLSTAVQATRMGASDFFEKPLDPDRILLAVRNLAEKMAMEKRLISLENAVEDEMVGESLQMRRVREAIRKAAPTEGRVMIFGENGTGKELVARAIHRGSLRHDRPFCSLNCAALPQDLVESELFGYEKGAFTGAIKRKPGRFETADGGTLFLDEIGDMGLDSQAKLLRVLETSEAMRLGGTSPYRFNVRIIAATNKQLAEEIKRGRFREDLYYRLNVIPIHVPSLRERREDIPHLARYALGRISSGTGKGLRSWGQGCVELLSEYDWPGNIRELKNFIERLVIMSDDKVIQADTVRSLLPQTAAALPQVESAAELSFREQVDQFESAILQKGFAAVNGNISALARRLQMDRANLHRKLKQHGLANPSKNDTGDSY